MAAKKVKKVTEIPEASVKIEVEQTEEDAKESESTETLEETEKVEVEETHDSEEESSEKDSTLEPVLNSLDEEGSGDNSISWKKIFLYTFVAAAIGILILLGFLYLFRNYDVSVTKKADSKAIALPSTAPTPTTAELDKEAYEITVLNGSGIAGEAAAVQEILEDAGFKVGTVGNAETADFTETEISAKSSVSEEYLDELEKTLGERGEVKVVDAPSSQTENVVVTVGSSKESDTEEVTPTP